VRLGANSQRARFPRVSGALNFREKLGYVLAAAYEGRGTRERITERPLLV
jgi:hypothetical protein